MRRELQRRAAGGSLRWTAATHRHWLRVKRIRRTNKKCPGLGGLGGAPTQAIGASFWSREGPKLKAVAILTASLAVG